MGRGGNPLCKYAVKVKKKISAFLSLSFPTWILVAFKHFKRPPPARLYRRFSSNSCLPFSVNLFCYVIITRRLICDWLLMRLDSFRLTFFAYVAFPGCELTAKTPPYSFGIKIFLFFFSGNFPRSGWMARDRNTNFFKASKWFLFFFLRRRTASLNSLCLLRSKYQSRPFGEK